MQRKDLPPLEMLDAGERIAAIFKPEMKERQGRAGKPCSGKLPEQRNGEPAETRDAAAAAAGTSPRTYHKIRIVAEAAKEDPETFGPIAEEMDPTGKVDLACRK